MKRIALALTLITLVLMCLMVFTGCKTPATVHTFEKSEKTITKHDTQFMYKGASVQNGASLDSIKAYLIWMRSHNPGIAPEVEYKDKDGKVAETFWLDKYGELQAMCESKDSGFYATITNQENFYEHKLEEQKKITVKEWYIPVGVWILVGIMIPLSIPGLILFGKTIIKIFIK